MPSTCLANPQIQICFNSLLSIELFYWAKPDSFIVQHSGCHLSRFLSAELRLYWHLSYPGRGRYFLCPSSTGAVWLLRVSIPQTFNLTVPTCESCLQYFNSERVGEVAEERVFYKAACFQLLLLFCHSHQTALAAFQESLMVMPHN